MKMGTKKLPLVRQRAATDQRARSHGLLLWSQLWLFAAIVELDTYSG